MIIEKLILKDFGIYAGEHWFDLTTTSATGRNVILIKGHNGGGKTTFFDAIKLALYGKRALGIRVAQSEYERYLLGRIHVGSSDRSAFVRIDLTRSGHGKNQRYSVRRSWAARGSSVVESLDVGSDDDSLSELRREDYGQYLQDLIPPGVSQLFFFDGERIQDMADEVAGDDVRRAIHSLLGLDLIEQLGTDLALYIAQRGDRKSGVDLERLVRDQRSISESVLKAEERRADLASRRDQVLRHVERAEHSFREEGGRIARDRNHIKAALDAIEVDRRRLLSELRLAAGGVLSLSLAPRTTACLAEAAQRIRSQRSSGVILDFIRSFELAHMETDNNQGVSWTSDHFRVLRQAVRSDSIGDHLTLDADPDWIIERLSMLHDGRAEEMGNLATSIEENVLQRVDIERQLRAFDDGLALEALERLKEYEYELGSVDAAIKQADEEIASLRRHRELTERLLRSAEEDLQRHTERTRTVDLAIRAQQALAEYRVNILNERMVTLKRNFVICFNRLIRKSPFVRKVEIDPSNFVFELVGQDGTIIPKADLSAGERQIFAISMLWALGRTSGRQLPVVIDTPFSRLDQLHRTNIIRDYVPSASDQVILLCTDTELTSDLEKMVSRYVARTYEISVPDGEQWTTLTEKAVAL